MERYPTGLSQPVTHTHHESGTPGQAPGTAAGGPERPLPAGDGPQELLAALGYLGTVFFSFLPPLIIYLVNR